MLDTIAKYALDGILAVTLGFFLKYGIPYLKSLATSKNLSFISEWVNTAVNAAEQKIQGSGMGIKKKEWAVKLLEQVGIVVDDTVDAMIEAAVKAMNESVNVLKEVVVQGVSEATDGIVTEEMANTAINSITGNDSTDMSENSSIEAENDTTAEATEGDTTTEALTENEGA